MSRFSSNASLFLRRAYSVAVENIKAQPAASVMRKVTEPSKELGVEEGLEREVFWMRDPKTGNWIPETHFNQIDVAELREKILSKAAKS